MERAYRPLAHKKTNRADCSDSPRPVPYKLAHIPRTPPSPPSAAPAGRVKGAQRGRSPSTLDAVRGGNTIEQAA